MSEHSLGDATPIIEDKKNSERLTDRIKSVLHNRRVLSGGHEMQPQMHESEKVAREALSLFANKEQQEPMAIYYADSPSIFQLDKQKPGTILRAKITSSIHEEPEENYMWLVVSSPIHQGAINSEYSVYTPYDSNPAPKPHVSKSQKLELPESWEFRLFNPSKDSFEIKDFNKVMYGGSIEGFTISELDVMSIGKDSQAPSDENKSNPTLTPVKEIA